MKPDFESAVVHTTFADGTLPAALRKLADYLEKYPDMKDYDDDMIIRCSYANDAIEKWYVSTHTDYWNEKKVISMIKNKRIKEKRKEKANEKNSI